MRTLVEFRPQSSLQSLLCVFESLRFSEEIQVGEDPEDVSRHAGGAENIQTVAAVSRHGEASKEARHYNSIVSISNP